MKGASSGHAVIKCTPKVAEHGLVRRDKFGKVEAFSFDQKTNRYALLRNGVQMRS